MPLITIFSPARAAAAAPRRDAFRAGLGLAPGRPVVLYAGKLQRLKRIEDLIAACAGLARERPELAPYLVIVGDGETRAEPHGTGSRCGSGCGLGRIQESN